MNLVKIALRPQHGTFHCETHTPDGDCPTAYALDTPTYAEPIDLDRGYGFDSIGSALCADCICAGLGDGKPPRAGTVPRTTSLATTEIVPLDEVSGTTGIERCSVIQCEESAVATRIHSVDGDPQFGEPLCGKHSA